MKIKVSLTIDVEALQGLKNLFPNTDIETEEAKCCKVPDCDFGHYALGYCQKHWRKFKTYGDPMYVSPLKNTKKEKKEWKRIQAICADRSHGLYHRYGGRGMVVCEEWIKSFSTFYKDMGSCPSSGAVIDCDSVVFDKESCVWKSLEEFREDDIKRASARFRR